MLLEGSHKYIMVSTFNKKIKPKFKVNIMILKAKDLREIIQLSQLAKKSTTPRDLVTIYRK